MTKITSEVVTNTSTQVADFSVFGLFLQADFIVKSVMILLIFTSFWCLSIIIEKFIRLKKLHKIGGDFQNEFWSGTSLEDLYEKVKSNALDPFSIVFGSAMKEWHKSKATGALGGTLQERIDRSMRIAIGKEMQKLEKNMFFLASVGSTAPFIGLFGTVWGIMNSFQSIAMSKNTSLAVVAPGIAEALAATALGLVAAIPAVIAYNKLSTEFGRYADNLDNFADEFMSILSRQLDQARG